MPVVKSKIEPGLERRHFSFISVCRACQPRSELLPKREICIWLWNLRFLTWERSGRKQLCMTHVVSLRMPREKVAAIDRRAADSGVDRTKYLLRLVEEDLARRAPKQKRRFASIHLLGKFQSKGSSNAQVRAAVKSQGEKDC